MLTLVPLLVPWVESRLASGLSSSFSSSGGPGLFPGWKNWGRVFVCYGNGSSSGLPLRGRPSSFEQARATKRRRFSHTRHTLRLSVFAWCCCWWDDVMLAILRRESSIHARTLRCFVDRSGCDPALPSVRAPESVCPFRNVLLSERKHRAQFCGLPFVFYTCKNVSRPLNLLLFSKIVTIFFSVHDVNNEMFSVYQIVTKQ